MEMAGTRMNRKRKRYSSGSFFAFPPFFCTSLPPSTNICRPVYSLPSVLMDWVNEAFSAPPSSKNVRLSGPINPIMMATIAATRGGLTTHGCQPSSNSSGRRRTEVLDTVANLFGCLLDLLLGVVFGVTFPLLTGVGRQGLARLEQRLAFWARARCAVARLVLLLVIAVLRVQEVRTQSKADL